MSRSFSGSNSDSRADLAARKVGNEAERVEKRAR